MGPPGSKASTHIYDAVVSHADFDGRLFLRSTSSRSPPQFPIHWKSTKRLQSPCLVGVVKLNSWEAALKREDRILWGEITAHGKPQDEHLRRENVILEGGAEGLGLGRFMSSW